MVIEWETLPRWPVDTSKMECLSSHRICTALANITSWPMVMLDPWAADIAFVVAETFLPILTMA